MEQVRTGNTFAVAYSAAELKSARTELITLACEKQQS